MSSLPPLPILPILPSQQLVTEFNSLVSQLSLQQVQVVVVDIAKQLTDSQLQNLVQQLQMIPKQTKVGSFLNTLSTII